MILPLKKKHFIRVFETELDYKNYILDTILAGKMMEVLYVGNPSMLKYKQKKKFLLEEYTEVYPPEKLKKQWDAVMEQLPFKKQCVIYKVNTGRKRKNAKKRKDS